MCVKRPVLFCNESIMLQVSIESTNHRNIFYMCLNRPLLQCTYMLHLEGESIYVFSTCVQTETYTVSQCIANITFSADRSQSLFYFVLQPSRLG